MSILKYTLTQLYDLSKQDTAKVWPASLTRHHCNNENLWDPAVAFGMTNVTTTVPTMCMRDGGKSNHSGSMSYYKDTPYTSYSGSRVRQYEDSRLSHQSMDYSKRDSRRKRRTRDDEYLLMGPKPRLGADMAPASRAHLNDPPPPVVGTNGTVKRLQEPACGDTNFNNSTSVSSSNNTGPSNSGSGNLHKNGRGQFGGYSAPQDDYAYDEYSAYLSRRPYASRGRGRGRGGFNEVPDRMAAPFPARNNRMHSGNARGGRGRGSDNVYRGATTTNKNLEPEWLSGGPENFGDTIELHGIHEDDASMLQFKRHDKMDSVTSKEDMLAIQQDTKDKFFMELEGFPEDIEQELLTAENNHDEKDKTSWMTQQGHNGHPEKLFTSPIQENQSSRRRPKNTTRSEMEQQEMSHGKDGRRIEDELLGLIRGQERSHSDYRMDSQVNTGNVESMLRNLLLKSNKTESPGSESRVIPGVSGYVKTLQEIEDSYIHSQNRGMRTSSTDTHSSPLFKKSDGVHVSSNCASPGEDCFHPDLTTDPQPITSSNTRNMNYRGMPSQESFTPKSSFGAAPASNLSPQLLQALQRNPLLLQQLLSASQPQSSFNMFNGLNDNRAALAVALRQIQIQQQAFTKLMALRGSSGGISGLMRAICGQLAASGGNDFDSPHHAVGANSVDRLTSYRNAAAAKSCISYLQQNDVMDSTIMDNKPLTNLPAGPSPVVNQDTFSSPVTSQPALDCDAPPFEPIRSRNTLNVEAMPFVPTRYAKPKSASFQAPPDHITTARPLLSGNFSNTNNESLTDPAVSAAKSGKNFTEIFNALQHARNHGMGRKAMSMSQPQQFNNSSGSQWYEAQAQQCHYNYDQAVLQCYDSPTAPSNRYQGNAN